MERTPLTDGRKEPATERLERGGEATGRRRGEPGSSFRRPPRMYLRLRSKGVQKKIARPALVLMTMSDAGEAVNLLQGLRTTASKEEMQSLSHSVLLDSVMVTIVQMGNDIMSLREAIAHNSNALSKAIMRTDKYKKESLAHAQNLARLHQEAKVREEGLGNRIKEAESWAETENGRASMAKAELERVSGQLEEIRAQNE